VFFINSGKKGLNQTHITLNSAEVVEVAIS